MYRWLVVLLLLCVCALNYADRQAVFSIFTILQKEFGFTKTELGLIGSSFMIVYAVLSPLAGWVGDRVSKKKIVLFGLWTWSLFTALTGFCAPLWSFVFVRAAEGVGETFYFPASTSLISDYHPGGTRSRALGLHHTGTYLGTILGGILAGYLAEHYGWRSPFFLFGLNGIFLGLILLLVLKDAPAAKRPEQVPLKTFLPELLKNRPVLALVAVFFLANFVTLPFYAWLPTFIAEKFGKSVAQAAFVGTFFFQGSSIVGAIVGGYTADVWTRRRASGRILTQAVGILGYAPFMFLMSSTPDYTSCIAAMCALGVFKGMYDANVWAAFYDLVPETRRGTLCGLANTTAWLGGSLSVFLIGVVVDRKIFSMSGALGALPLLNILMAALLLWAGSKIGRRK